MSLPFALACGWLVLTNVIGMFPSKHNHWPAAFGLIALGLPLLAWVFVENGPLAGLVVLIAAASVLRWPLRYLLRWIVGAFRSRSPG